jgi:hypothetical protein
MLRLGVKNWPHKKFALRKEKKFLAGNGEKLWHALLAKLLPLVRGEAMLTGRLIRVSSNMHCCTGKQAIFVGTAGSNLCFNPTRLATVCGHVRATKVSRSRVHACRLLRAG